MPLLYFYTSPTSKKSLNSFLLKACGHLIISGCLVSGRACTSCCAAFCSPGMLCTDLPSLGAAIVVSMINICSWFLTNSKFSRLWRRMRHCCHSPFFWRNSNRLQLQQCLSIRLPILWPNRLMVLQHGGQDALFLNPHHLRSLLTWWFFVHWLCAR